MSRLLLVRHGETDWNAAGRIQGSSDPPLNENGCRQAEALARRLADEPLETVICSDLQRAYQTAEAILAHHPQIRLETEPRLREMDFGLWDGLTFDEVRERYPQEAKAWLDDWQHNAPPEGESFPTLVARVSGFFEELRGSKPETALITAHGGPLQVLICLALGLEAERYWQFHLEPGALIEVRLHESGGSLHIHSPSKDASER